MHDPKTLAFSIKWPWKNKHGYKYTLIDIWHVDPLNFKFADGTEKQGGRRDDSCGWHTPMYHVKEWEGIKKLGKSQYRELFARQIAHREGNENAQAFNGPETAQEIIYWMWRSIKAHGRKDWQYGNAENFLTLAEQEQIMLLASNPVDNLRPYLQRIESEEQFVDVFRMVWNRYRRFHRPWYKHPRWHIHHWQIQFCFIRDIKRRFWDKCSVCGKRGFKTSAYSDWGGTRIWHSECDKSVKMPATDPL